MQADDVLASRGGQGHQDLLGFDNLRLHPAVGQFTQGSLENWQPFNPETGSHCHIGSEIFIQDLALLTSHQQADTLQVGVGEDQHDGMGKHLLGTRHSVHHQAHRLGICPHQPTCAQLGATEVARDNNSHVTQPAAAQHCQGWATSCAGRLAGIRAVGDLRVAMPNEVEGHVVGSIGELNLDAGNEGFGIIDREDGGKGGDEA